jgi:high affinity sulfate transporter 1
MKNTRIASWLFNYDSKWFKADLVAGLTTAAVAIPKAMAYAVIAGLPVEIGLYTALAASLIYPLLGSSRPLSVTTTSAIAMLSATVIATASVHSATPATSIAATLAALVGLILILARFLKLGFLADFISLPVLVGFQAGIGVVIILGQLGALLGVHTESHTGLGILQELPGLLSETKSVSLMVGLSGFAVLLALPRLLPKIPSSLLWIALAIVTSAVLGLQSMGVKTVGTVPPGLPTFSIPDVSVWLLLLPGAAGIALMSFTESVAAARSFRQRNDPPIDANKELIAVGAANIASALVGGLPTGGGASQTAMAEASGVRSQLAQWVNAAVVVLCLFVLSDTIALLPKPALAALIIIASLPMIKPEDFRSIAQIRPMEFSWALITMAGVILIGTLEGILIAVAISILSLFYQATRPPVYTVAYNIASKVFRREGDDPEDTTFPGLLILRTEGRINFANASTTREKMHAMVQNANPRVVILECSAIPDFEYTALSILTETEADLRNRGITLWLAGLNPGPFKTITASPLGRTLGENRIFTNLSTAFNAWQHRENSSNKPETAAVTDK